MGAVVVLSILVVLTVTGVVLYYNPLLCIRGRDWFLFPGALSLIPPCVLESVRVVWAGHWHVTPDLDTEQRCRRNRGEIFIIETIQPPQSQHLLPTHPSFLPLPQEGASQSYMPLHGAASDCLGEAQTWRQDWQGLSSPVKAVALPEGGF